MSEASWQKGVALHRVMITLRSTSTNKTIQRKCLRSRECLHNNLFCFTFFFSPLTLHGVCFAFSLRPPLQWVSNKTPAGKGGATLLSPPPATRCFLMALRSQLDLKSLVQLSGEGVCGGRGGALVRAVLQRRPLGFERVFLLCRCRLAILGRRGRPAFGAVEGGPAVWGLDVNLGGRRGFDIR